jgi:hypothetical protein
MSSNLSETASRLRSIIVNFAGRITGAANDSGALAYAEEHGWLGKDGSVTADGRRLADALLDQTGARSAFRNI